jgi:formate dehydrogenase iron-sulfur subunit
MDRRDFLKMIGGGSAALLPALPSRASDLKPDLSDGIGVLVDTTVCIGCRKCEWNCNKSNGLPEHPLEHFEDKTAFETYRRPTHEAYTVVNQFENEGKPMWAKVQCMHCLDPACVSACIVSAFERDEMGRVVYDPWRCMGCRYCMVACPFQIPAYEYDNALDPVVRKCTFCFEKLEAGQVPACVEICPVECLTYGKRSELLEMAHGKIERQPERYHDHVYGEHEVGGTAWLYLSPKPMAELNFPELGTDPVPNVTETIQHSVFKNFIPPLALATILGQLMYFSQQKAKETAEEVEA